MKTIGCTLALSLFEFELFGDNQHVKCIDDYRDGESSLCDSSKCPCIKKENVENE